MIIVLQQNLLGVSHFILIFSCMFHLHCTFFFGSINFATSSTLHIKKGWKQEKARTLNTMSKIVLAMLVASS